METMTLLMISTAAGTNKFIANCMTRHWEVNNFTLTHNAPEDVQNLSLAPKCQLCELRKSLPYTKLWAMRVIKSIHCWHHWKRGMGRLLGKSMHTSWKESPHEIRVSLSLILLSGIKVLSSNSLDLRGKKEEGPEDSQTSCEECGTTSYKYQNCHVLHSLWRKS